MRTDTVQGPLNYGTLCPGNADRQGTMTSQLLDTMSCQCGQTLYNGLSIIGHYVLVMRTDTVKLSLSYWTLCPANADRHCTMTFQFLSPKIWDISTCLLSTSQTHALTVHMSRLVTEHGKQPPSSFNVQIVQYEPLLCPVLRAEVFSW